jgi:CHAD domain-containing protein
VSKGQRVTEREVKLGLDEGFSLDRIDGLVVRSTDDRSLDATYFDTADLRLLSLGHTLRHRSGEGAAGAASGGTWTLKLAGVSGDVDGRDEITLEGALDGALGRPPRPLLGLVAAVVGDEPVVAVAHLLTQRRRHVAVYDGTDVEIAIDVVTGTPAATPTATPAATLTGAPSGPVSFRQLEIELVDGDERMLPRLAAKACRAGAFEASQEPKVATVLGDWVRSAHLVAVPLRGRSTVDDLVRSAVTAALRQLLTHDPHLRLDAPDDSVHKARVATRRLRSDLRTLGAVLDDDAVSHMTDELRWVAAQIGAVRDIDVLAEHVGEWAIPLGHEGAVIAPALLARLRNERFVAALVMRNALQSRRYRAMVDELRRWSAAPPWRQHAHRDRRARPDALDMVRRADARVRHAVERLGDPPATLDLHELRKRAKRCRYAAELVSPLVDDDLDDLADEMARLQDVLGGLQDAAVAQRWLRGLPLWQMDEREAAAVDRLAEVAGQAAIDAHARWPDQWDRAKRKRLRPWD